MGTACCKPESADKGYNRPVWQPEHPITAEELQQMRDQFWDTEPHYGGDRGGSFTLPYRTTVVAGWAGCLAPQLVGLDCCAGLVFKFHAALIAVIWDALKAACAADMATAKLILDTAGVTVAAQVRAGGGASGSAAVCHLEPIHSWGFHGCF